MAVDAEQSLRDQRGMAAANGGRGPELLINLAIALAGIWIFVVFDGLVVRIGAIFVSTVGSNGVSTNTHTSSHYATSRKRWVNELLTFFGYPIFVGMSACYWWHKHVVAITKKYRG